jgi:hypothetical protein
MEKVRQLALCNREAVMAEQISKQEAVRRAMAALGDDAKLAQMQGWIKQQCGIDMTTDHISTARGEIRRKKGGTSKPAAKTRAAAARTAPPKAAPKAAAPEAPASRGKEAAIPLADILTVRELVDRHGAGALHTLINAVAK